MQTEIVAFNALKTAVQNCTIGDKNDPVLIQTASVAACALDQVCWSHHLLEIPSIKC